MEQKPLKNWKSFVECFYEMSLSFEPWTIKQGLATSYALYLLLNRCFSRPEATCP